MEVILFILGALLVFILLGIFGWICEIFKYIFEFLWEGCTKSIGCLIFIIIVIILLCGI